MKIKIRERAEKKRNQHEGDLWHESIICNLRISGSDQVKEKPCIGPLFNHGITRYENRNNSQQLQHSYKTGKIIGITQMSHEFFCFGRKHEIRNRGKNHESREQNRYGPEDDFRFFHKTFFS